MDQNAEQLERIRDMSNSLEMGASLLDSLEEMLNLYEQSQPMFGKLSAYYESAEWKQDHADDEGGRLPAELERGALSEDGIDHLLDKNREMAARMKEIADKLQKT
ncbi:MAG: DUF4298 domain-containing protein [Lachnospiraceae bacterium]|nr:DUF4298 domain-containing protein [Lachnospiraceae bacterium]